MANKIILSIKPVAKINSNHEYIVDEKIPTGNYNWTIKNGSESTSQRWEYIKDNYEIGSSITYRPIKGE